MSKRKINPFASIDEVLKQVETNSAQRKARNEALLNTTDEKTTTEIEQVIPKSDQNTYEMGTLTSTLKGNIKPELEEKIPISNTYLNVELKNDIHNPKGESERIILKGNNKPVYKTNKSKLIELGIIDQNQLKKDNLNTNTKYVAVLKVLINSALDSNKIIEEQGQSYRVTGMVLVGAISEQVNSSQQVVKNIIRDLLERFNIKRIHSEVGRNGFVIYGFEDSTFSNIVKMVNNSKINGYDKSVPKEEPKPIQMPSSKLVSYNTTKLTNTSDLNPDEFDLSKIAKFGITKKHLNDLRNQQLSLTNMTLQDFANRFAIYASNSANVRNVASLPGLFCKMAQLVAKSEDPLLDIETDEDRAINERIDVLRRKKEEKDRREAELMDLEFQDWFGSMDQDNLLDLVPDARIVSNPEVRINIIKQHFINNIWRGL